MKMKPNHKRNQKPLQQLPRKKRREQKASGAYVITFRFHQFFTHARLQLDKGGKRKVTVSQWKNQTRIDIREFYEKDGEVLPGRKGISLSVDQWELLKELIPKIDNYIENL